MHQLIFGGMIHRLACRTAAMTLDAAPPAKV